ncbi:hypothetical protein OIU85_000219 [Salix viminalis]|uniref:HAT C-terminal dimerisation domain-containing protein n=1 Tax=Salix viminalis TaxID=40686 RepID=A0A9Q0VJG0_SALVM|nr:hypothetical protein OIU85_000219 [Salix viminalis]
MVVVNWGFILRKLLAQDGAIEQVLLKVKDLEADIMVIAEQEANLNSPDLSNRLEQSLQYYSTIFESLEQDDDRFMSRETYFRRQIGNVVACEGIDRVERIESFDQWQHRLSQAGFCPVPLEALDLFTCNHLLALQGFRIELKDGHIKLSWHGFPLAVASAWKLTDPPQSSSGYWKNMLEGPSVMQDRVDDPEEMASSSESEDDEENDPCIMADRNLWSTQGSSMNRIAASAKLFDILEYICHIYKLPAAVTWISYNREGDTNSNEKRLLLIDSTACYTLMLVDKFHDISVPDPADFPDSDSQRVWQNKTFNASFAIRLTSTHSCKKDYVLDFFLPKDMEETSERELMISDVVCTLQKICFKSWKVWVREQNEASGFGVRLDDEKMSNIPYEVVSNILQLPSSDGGSSTSVIQRNYPIFEFHSKDDVEANVLAICRQEKEKLIKYFDSISCLLSLTLELWSSNDKMMTYCCLTLHFIDDGWHLKKKILAFRNIRYNYDRGTVLEFIKSVLAEWRINKNNKNVHFIILDITSPKEHMFRELRSKVSYKAPLVHGHIFCVPSYAQILSLLVQDGFSEIRSLLYKIRECIVYVNGSSLRRQWFQEAINNGSLQDKEMPFQDVPARWDTTFLMLESSLEFREAFNHLEQLDCDFKVNPSTEEWNKATSICECLKELHKSASNFPTTLEGYFLSVRDVYKNLLKWEQSEHVYVRSIANRMKGKFDEYWGEASLALGISVVLNPSFKLKLVKYGYHQIYGSEYNLHFSKFLDNVTDVYNKYDEGPSSSAMVDESLWPSSDISFEVSVLGKMARDFLAIPVSTVISKSSEVMKMASVHDGVHPEIAEALICGKDWLDSRS